MAWLATAHGPGADAERFKHREALLALFRKDPGTIRRAYALLIEDPNLGYVARLLIVDAIGLIDDADLAHSLLRELINNPTVDDSLKDLAIQVLSWPKTTPRESIDLLLEKGRAQGSISFLALEALGRIVRRARETDPSRAQALLGQMLDIYHRFKNARDEEQIARSLHGLSLTGMPEVDPIVREALGDGSREVRRSALLAIGQYNPPDRFDVALGVFRTEGDPYVRTGAIEALMPAPWQPVTVQWKQVDRVPAEVRSALIAAMFTERDDEVRASIMEYWNRCYQGEGSVAPRELIDAVKLVASADPSPLIRGKAAWTLECIRGFAP